MATHAAEPTGADKVGDLCAAVRKHGPYILEIAGTGVAIVVMSVILIDARLITAGVVLLFTFLPAEGFLVAWKAMRAPWDKLSDKDGDE